MYDVILRYTSRNKHNARLDNETKILQMRYILEDLKIEKILY